jgi:hypothetical protein
MEKTTQDDSSQLEWAGAKRRWVFAVRGPAGCGKGKTVRSLFYGLPSKFPRAEREPRSREMVAIFALSWR